MSKESTNSREKSRKIALKIIKNSRERGATLSEIKAIIHACRFVDVFNIQLATGEWLLCDFRGEK